MKKQSVSPKHLILGGVKSGKSRHAETLAQACSDRHGAQVTVIATATANDAEMQQRIALHKAGRNPHWRVVEEPIELGCAIESVVAQTTPSTTTHCIIVDCLTLWMTNLLVSGEEALLGREIAAFLAATRHCSADLIIVSNETNLGVTPTGAMTRRFCDEIGILHQILGQEFDRVSLMVAGHALDIR